MFPNVERPKSGFLPKPSSARHGQFESAPRVRVGERYLTENPYGNFDWKILLKISLSRFRIIGSVLLCFGDNHPRQVRSWFTALSSSQFRSVGMGDFGSASIASHSFTVMILKTLTSEFRLCDPP